jgi:hypothetical protein
VPPPPGTPAPHWRAAFDASGVAAPAHENPNEPAPHPGTASSSSQAAADFAKGMQQWPVAPEPEDVPGPHARDGSEAAGPSGPTHE